jgi:SAM-dependent methyltransferase
MNSDTGSESEYPDGFITRLQFKWGEGFLSPGGEEEVAEMLKNANLSGCKVLDIGCGLGAIDVLLVEKHGAAEVIGIDVEKPLLDKAIQLARDEGLSSKIEFQLVEPGPLPFPSESFDIVFSKDALIHIPDKAKLYSDIYRALRPGGMFVASDWYKADGPCAELANFLINDLGLSIGLETLEETSKLLSRIGFAEVKGRDRHDWFREDARQDLERLKGPMYEAFIKTVGEEGAQLGIAMNEKMVSILDAGELRPGHFCATKPN